MDAPLFFEHTRRRLGWSGVPESGWGCLELAGGASGQALSMRPTEANRAIASARVSVQTEEDHHEHVTTRKLQWPSLGRPLGTVVTSGVRA